MNHGDIGRKSRDCLPSRIYGVTGNEFLFWNTRSSRIEISWKRVWETVRKKDSRIETIPCRVVYQGLECSKVRRLVVYRANILLYILWEAVGIYGTVLYIDNTNDSRTVKSYLAKKTAFVYNYGIYRTICVCRGLLYKIWN